MDRPPLTRDLVIALLEQGALDEVRAHLSVLHAEEVADLIESLPPERGSQLLNALESEEAGEALVELDDHTMEEVLEEMSAASIADAVETMAADDAADVIGALPESQRRQVLEDLDEAERSRFSDLLTYSEESAGGIMTPEVVAVPITASAKDVIRSLRGLEKAHDDVLTVYVVDEVGKLVGRLPLHALVTAEKHAVVAELVEAPAISCHVELDQEDVARLMARYNLVTLPVVDDENRLVGRITFDDVIDIVAEEATEDILRMAGSSEREVAERSALRIARVRLPWVIVGLTGGLVSGYFMSLFEGVLHRVLGLAFFVPAVAALGGNVGIQSSTIVIRGMTMGDYTYTGILQPILREIRVGLTVGAVCGLLAGLVAQFWFGDLGMGLIVGLAMWGTAISAAVVGSSLPFLFDRFGIDPAVATGPFITTANDVIGILLYFVLAQVLFGLMQV